MKIGCLEETCQFWEKSQKFGVYLENFAILGKNSEHRVSNWKTSHFWAKSRKKGVFVEKFPFQAKISKKG